MCSTPVPSVWQRVLESGTILSWESFSVHFLFDQSIINLRHGIYEVLVSHANVWDIFYWAHWIYIWERSLKSHWIGVAIGALALGRLYGHDEHDLLYYSRRACCAWGRLVPGTWKWGPSRFLQDMQMNSLVEREYRKQVPYITSSGACNLTPRSVFLRLCYFFSFAKSPTRLSSWS